MSIYSDSFRSKKFYEETSYNMVQKKLLAIRKTALKVQVMEKKLSMAICIILLFMLSTTLGASIPIVNAYDYGYGCASSLYTTNWRQYQNNAEVTADAFNTIAGLFAEPMVYMWLEGYGWVPVYHVYGDVQNYGTATNPSLVFNRIDHVNSEHSEFATVLYVGHGTANGFYGYSLLGQEPDLIHYDDNYDDDIESHTSSSPTHHFVLNWVCKGYDPFPYGSVTAWNPLWWSYPPAYGEYTWIGFEEASPWLIEHMNPTNIYKYWLVFFYYFALHENDYTVMQALNYASIYTGFANYASSILATGFQTYWPYPPHGPRHYDGSMEIAGDPLGTDLPTSMCIYP
jgi:hypothetical protein